MRAGSTDPEHVNILHAPARLSTDTDRLSALPVELLSYIFDLAHTYDAPLTGPFSKSLLPFFRRTIYRAVVVHTPLQLVKLCDTARSNGTLLSHTRRLEIKLPMFGPDEDCDEWEEQREGMPGRDSAEVLLDTLEHLEELDVEGSSRVAKAFLRIGPSSSTSTTLFDTLRALDITAVFQYRIDPFADLYLWNLKRYKRLTTFSLDVRRDLTELRGIGYTPDEFPCPELLDLSLTGILSSSEYIPVILATCSCLTSLALCETSIDATVMILLESVQHPELIRHLQVWVTNEDAECTGDPVAQLARFSNLESIVIQGYWFPQTHGFYSTLSKLPLKTISFKEDTDVSIEHLLKLVSGPTKMSTLESIELNNVDASRGDLLPRDQGAEAVRDADLIGLNWNLPTWSRFFDRQGLRNLLRVAQSENIRIEGYSVTSLAIDDEWDKELEFYNSMVEPLTSVE